MNRTTKNFDLKPVTTLTTPAAVSSAEMRVAVVNLKMPDLRRALDHTANIGAKMCQCSRERRDDQQEYRES